MQKTGNHDLTGVLDIEMDKSVDMKDTFDKLCRLIGEPRNYGPTPEEKAEIDRIAQEERVRICKTIIAKN